MGPAGAGHGEQQWPRRSNPGSQPESVLTSSWARMSSLSTGAGNNLKMVQKSTGKVKGECSRTGRQRGDLEQQYWSTAGSEQQYVGVSTASGLFTQPAQPLIFNTLDPTTTILHCISSPREDFSPPSASHIRLDGVALNQGLLQPLKHPGVCQDGPSRPRNKKSPSSQTPLPLFQGEFSRRSLGFDCLFSCWPQKQGQPAGHLTES